MHRFPATPVSTQPLQRYEGVFSQFAHTGHYQGPAPPPPRWTFYWRNFRNHFVKSYEDGFFRWFKMIKDKPVNGALTVGTGLALGALFTAFHRHKRLVESVFLLGFLGYPVIAAVKYLPKLDEAYTLAKDGEPAKAQKKFRQAMDELVYKIGHVYLKPLSLGAFIIAPLMTFRRSARWMLLRGAKLASGPAEERLGVMAMRAARWLLAPLKHIGLKSAVLSPLEARIERAKAVPGRARLLTRALRKPLHLLGKGMLWLANRQPFIALDRVAVYLARQGDRAVKHFDHMPWIEKINRALDEGSHG